jgi:hypothetical protein
MSIGKFSIIFKEMLGGDTEMPAATTICQAAPLVWQLLPVCLTIAALRYSYKVGLKARFIFVGCCVTIINFGIACFINWAMLQPWVTIITKFQAS